MDARKKTAIVLLAALLALAVVSGCVKKAKIDIVRPGEMKLTDVSKIALLDFNTIAPAPGYGIYAADRTTCGLARTVVADVLYREPFYQLVDFGLEDVARAKNPGAKLQTRADAFLYGRVWWQAAPEFDNFVPDKMALEEWGMQRYVCGRDGNGNPQYCTARLTRKVQDEFFKRSYRATNAALMLGLSVYRLQKNGQVTKLSTVFEIARHPAIISNGEFSDSLEIVGKAQTQDRAATLKTKSGLDQFMDFIGVETTAEAKDFDQKETAKGQETIPTALECKTRLCNELSGELARLIAPRTESFDVAIAGFDQKSQKLIIESAFVGLVKYVGEGKLAGGNPEIAEYFYATDFIGGARELARREHKAEWEAGKKSEPYKPLTGEELDKEALDYLSGHAGDIYNFGLAFEALGDFERALEIYRFGFSRFKTTDQDYADGIGRCLFALDMADRVIEVEMEKTGAKDKTKL